MERGSPADSGVGPWDIPAVKHLINGRAWKLRQPPLARWIEEHGGVEQIWAYLRTRPLPAELRRLLELILDHPDERSSFYLARLPMHRATFSAQLTRLCAALAALLNGWKPERGSQGEQPALQTLLATSAPAPLPVPLTSLVGRTAELAEVCAQLHSPRVRLLTLTGTGGIGKTRLALQAAAELQREGAWTVVLVELAPIGQPEHVAPAVAHALGIKQGLEQGVQAAILERLRAQPTLLVLDNFEHLLEAAPLLATLLARAPELKLLVTSRARLHLSGEHELVVPPLSLPQQSGQAELEAARHSEAVQLFFERAQALRPGLVLTADNAEAVVAICRRLDGLPLAIELAAARSKHFAPQALAARLRESLELLTNGPRDLPARQQTLRDTIAWSYDLLAPAEQRLLAQLAVFPGGCLHEAAAEVCDALPPAQLLDAMCSLADKSLLRETSQPQGEPRFLMLETIRAFALEQLERQGEAAQRRARHAAYYLALAERIEPELTRAEQHRWLWLLGEEYENLRAALRWLLACRDEERALRLCWALWKFWKLRGYQNEGLRLIEQALALGGTPGARPSPELLRTRAKAQLAAGWLALELHWRFGHPLPDAGSFARCLDLAHAVEDDKLIAMALQGLGASHELRGELEQSRALHERSRAICEATGEDEEQAWALTHLASLANDLDDVDGALALLEQSVRLFRQVGHVWGVGVALGHQGTMTLRRDRRAYARERLDQALAIMAELEDRPGTLHILRHLSILAVREQDHARAATLIEASLEIAQQVGDLRAMADLRIEQGRLARRQGAPEQARQLYAESLRLHQGLGRTIGVVVCLEDLAELELEQGGAERACRLLAAAQALREQTGQPLLDHEQHHADALVAQLRGQLGDQTFAAAWAHGQQLEPATAARYALDKPESA